MSNEKFYKCTNPNCSKSFAESEYKSILLSPDANPLVRSGICPECSAGKVEPSPAPKEMSTSTDDSFEEILARKEISAQTRWLDDLKPMYEDLAKIEIQRIKDYENYDVYLRKQSEKKRINETKNQQSVNQPIKDSINQNSHNKPESPGFPYFRLILLIIVVVAGLVHIQGSSGFEAIFALIVYGAFALAIWFGVGK